MSLNWLSEAVRARDKYKIGRAYKDYPVPGSNGWCARAARVLFREVTGKPLPFAGKDANHDGDVDALDMLRLEREAGYVKPYQLGMPLKCGMRLYWTGGKHGHVATIVSESPCKAFENTSAKRLQCGIQMGPGTCIVLVSRLPRPAFVGVYTGDE